MSKSELTPIVELKAIIYCRVSSKKQTIDGSGLESQELRCREYADTAGIAVEKVITDNTSGGGDYMNRPGIKAILKHLKANKDCNYVVIFDDLKRLSRDTHSYIELRHILAASGAIVRCLNFKFEDTPEGVFVETIIAAQGQLEREQNGRQTSQKMRARLKHGYWAFKTPIGYKYVNSKQGGGKVLVRDEPFASIIEKALKGFSTGRLKTPADVRNYLDSHPSFPKNKETGGVRFETVERLLRNVLYAGHLQYPKWNIALTKATHPALISLEEYQRIQDILDKKKKGFTRRDENPEFPLRGIIACDGCGKPLTAAWSKGKSKSYPYYRCQRHTCTERTKSIPRDALEEDLCQVLENITPSSDAIKIARAMMVDAVKVQKSELEDAAKAAKKKLKDIDLQKDALIDRIANASNVTLIEAYERRLLELEGQRPFLAEKSKVLTTAKEDDGQDIELALDFLSSPCKIYKNGSPEARRMVAKLVFSEPVRYSPAEGYRTPKLSLPFRALDGMMAQNGKMVPPHGLEPRTH